MRYRFPTAFCILVVACVSIGLAQNSGCAASLSLGSVGWYTITSAGVLCDKAGPYGLSGSVSQSPISALGPVDAGPYYIIGGFWSSEFDARIGRRRDEVVVSSLRPGAFKLYRNFPNPFSRTTRIAYDLPLGGKVYLSIRDVSGRQVKTLADGWQDAGRYSLTWDGRDKKGRACPTGVYFCSLRTEDHDAVKKMLLTE
jgi:FlgD Ig-like domain